jgi:drug/metabolite transporter (DMT)-like permease
MTISDTQSGLLFAGATAVCWSCSAFTFSRSSRQVGSLAVNIIRLIVAALFFSIYGYCVRGKCLPTDASLHTWGWLSLSGFTGFFLGDLFLFRSFSEIGVRLSMLIMSLAPVFVAVTGWLWLSETMSARHLIGMAVTISGVMWVIMERPVKGPQQSNHVSLKGIAYAALGAAGQGLGVVIGKYGMISQSGTQTHIYDPFAATQIRTYAGILSFALLIAYLGRTKDVLKACHHLKPMTYITIGALFGPFLGVALLMRSIQLIPSGISQTIAATVPVLLIPVAIVVDKEKVTLQSLIGTAVAIGGVGILSW